MVGQTNKFKIFEPSYSGLSKLPLRPTFINFHVSDNSSNTCTKYQIQHGLRHEKNSNTIPEQQWQQATCNYWQGTELSIYQRVNVTSDCAEQKLSSELHGRTAQNSKAGIYRSRLLCMSPRIMYLSLGIILHRPYQIEQELQGRSYGYYRNVAMNRKLVDGL